MWITWNFRKQNCKVESRKSNINVVTLNNLTKIVENQKYGWASAMNLWLSVI